MTNDNKQQKRFSKSQKTAFFKTAGWSFGSILFTILIGLWVYTVTDTAIAYSTCYAQFFRYEWQEYASHDYDGELIASPYPNPKLE